MRSRVCVDASLIIALFIPERFSSSSLALWSNWVQEDIETVAPQLLRYEVTSALYHKANTNQVSFDDAKEALNKFISLEIIYMDPMPLPLRALDLAEQNKRPNTYDSHYLALAEYLDCPFWTLDERFYNATHTKFDLINWVGAAKNSFV